MNKVSVNGEQNSASPDKGMGPFELPGCLSSDKGANASPVFLAPPDSSQTGPGAYFWNPHFG
jgi:hypothetical protein